MPRKVRWLDDERIVFLRSMDGTSRKEIWRRFNERYEESIPYTTMVQRLQKLGVSAPDSHFKRGHDPWNKGMSRDEYRKHFTDSEWEEMTGRVLNAPHKRNKIGDVKVIKGKSGPEPWIVVRTGEKLKTMETLQQLDRFIWEKKVGKIPETYCIVHLNYNALDCRLENLALIKKSWLGNYSRWMRSEFPEINKTTIMVLTLQDALKASESKGVQTWQRTQQST